MNQKDLERLNELKLSIYGRVAYSIVEKEEDPYNVPENLIESHAGRRPKAIRLLTKAGVIEKLETNEYRVKTFDDDSQSFEVKPDTSKSVRDLNTAIDTSAPPQRIYNEIFTTTFSSAEEIYLYWHLKDFERVGATGFHSHDFVELCEKEKNIKALLRVFVERHLKANFQVYLCKNFPETEVDEAKEKNISFTARRPISLDNFKEQSIQKILDKIQVEHDRLQKHFKSINLINNDLTDNEKFKESLATMRKQAIEDLLNQQSKEKSFLSIIKKFKDLFTYEALYTDDEIIDLSLDNNFWGSYQKYLTSYEIKSDFFNVEKDENGKPKANIEDIEFYRHLTGSQYL